MPIYDYLCKGCGVEHEISHSMNSQAQECPSCGSKELQKLITAPAGIVFNGSGFYETDYKRKGSGKSESANVASESGGSSGNSGGSCKHNKSACACH